MFKPELYIPVWVAIVYGLAPLLNTIGQFILHKKMDNVVTKVEDVKHEVNGKMSQLLKVSGEAEFAKGVLQEKDRNITP